MSLLAISGLHVALGRRQVLKDFSCRIGAGEFVGLIGRNGAGKSTLLRSALGLVPSRGEIVIAGHDAARMSVRQRARQIAYLPQEREIAWDVSVEMLVFLGREPHRKAFSGVGAADLAAVEGALRRMGLEDFRERRATELSGGEKARVLIARALVQQAPLLLADEPTAGLDPSNQIALMRVFAGLAAEGHAVVASMHDLGLAARWCSRLILIDGGRVVADGEPRAVLTPQLLRSVYGVTAHIAEAEGGLIVQPLDLAPAPEEG